MLRRGLLLPAAVLALAGCAPSEQAAPDPRPSSASSASSTSSPDASSPPTASPSADSPAPPATDPPVTFDSGAAYAVVAELAGGVGPREASGPAFAAAADLVAGRFAELGYTVSRVPVAVPAGQSWGVGVPAGQSQNVVAVPPAFDPALPHRLVGAHLDTVPQAPGAEDNASGVGVLLELARMAAAQPPAVPVVLVAFGAEEPRGPGDALHHFGSQQMVAALPPVQRDALTGMVSLDRVGVPTAELPVCHGGRSPDAVRDALLAAAARLGIAARACENRASDHWSFEKAGVAVARIGSVPYAGYHSPGDVPAVVDPGQLERAAGRLGVAHRPELNGGSLVARSRSST